MSEPYQAYLLFPDGIQPELAVDLVGKIFADFGGVIDEDSLLILEDFDAEEPEAEYVQDSEKALMKLKGWPTMGSIDFMVCAGMTTVAFKKTAGQVKAIEVSILSSAFERSEYHRACYMNLIVKLDELFGPTRTIMQWGLESIGFNWKEEVVRLKKGSFTKSYLLLDIQRKSKR